MHLTQSSFYSKTTALLIVLTLFQAGALGQGHGRQALTEKDPRAFEKQEALEERQQLHQWLMSERVSEGIASPIRAEVSAQEKSLIDSPAADPRGSDNVNPASNRL